MSFSSVSVCECGGFVMYCCHEYGFYRFQAPSVIINCSNPSVHDQEHYSDSDVFGFVSDMEPTFRSSKRFNNSSDQLAKFSP